MKYVALLRGINVGGNNIIKMALLKQAFLSSGFENVSTYIQSGNVLFESDEKVSKKLVDTIERMLTKTFKYTARIMLRSQKEMKKIIDQAPKVWHTRNDIRCYVGFLSDTVSKKDITDIEVREGIDTLDTGKGVIYMTTLTRGLTKSKFTKMAVKPIYKEMTIRNFNTTKKLLDLMEKI